jgi:hypothetical protein
MFLALLLIQAAYGLAPFYRQAETIDRHVEGVHQRSYFVMFNEKAPVFGMNKEKLQSWLPAGMPEVLPENVQHIYEITENFRGYAAWILPEKVETILAYDFVKYVEEDQVMRAYAPFTTRPDYGQTRINQKGAANLATVPANLYATSYPSGNNATDGTGGWDWATTVKNNYRYPNTGSSSRVWIVDTGININHQEFVTGGRSRVLVSVDYVNSTGGGVDCNGHGTHCAGSAAGQYRGVATGAEIGNVRVLNCQGSGTNANVVAGFNYVANNQAAGRMNILSASLGGGQSTTTDNAINNGANAGVIPVVAAGNDSNANACNYSPAGAAQAITVAASNKDDTRASFSNAGTCVNVFAPGQSIHSSWYTSTTAYNTISGTSMATPLTAGAIAVYGTMSGNVGQRVAAVKTAIANTGTSGRLASVGLTGTPNLIVNSQWN